MNELEQRIIVKISELCAVTAKDIKSEDRLREDLGMDSVSSMELLSVLAEEFDLEIEMEEAVQITTVAAVLSFARQKMGARP